MENNLKKSKKKGFTLIELIIVLAVMAIIAAIAVPSFKTIKESSAEKADKQSAAAIERTATILAADDELVDGKYVITMPTSEKTKIDKDSIAATPNKEGNDTTKSVEALVNGLDQVKQLQSDKYKNATVTIEVANKSATAKLPE